MFCSWSFHFTFSGNTRVELHWKTHLYQMGIFVGCNRSLPPSISPAPIFARSFSRSWSMSKIFCFFCCSPILSSAAECKLQQSASAIALGSVHPNGKFVFKRSRKNIPEELQHKFSSTGVFVPLLHLVKPHNLSIENWIGETQLPERT